MTALYQLSYATPVFLRSGFDFPRIFPELFFINDARKSLKEEKFFLLQSLSGRAFYTANKKRESDNFPSIQEKVRVEPLSFKAVVSLLSILDSDIPFHFR